MKTKLFAICFTGLVFVVGCGQKPPQYQASAIVGAVIGKTIDELPEEEAEQIRKEHTNANELASMRVSTGKETSAFLTADIALLRSFVAEMVTNKADKVSVGQYRDTGLIKISVASDNSQEAIDICNQVAKRYSESTQRDLKRDIIEKATGRNITKE